MEELVLGKGLKLNSIRFADKVAMVFQGKRIVYAELNGRVNRLANSLIARVVDKGEKVTILLHNCTEFLEILFALAKAGVVAVPVSYRSTAKDLEYIVNHSDARALIFGADFEEVVRETRPKIQRVQEFIAVGEKSISWAENYENLLLSGSEDEPAVEVHETDPIWIPYTSGTTGTPKGCVGVHRGWVLQMPITCMECDIRHNDIFLNTGPLYHVAPLWMSLLFLYIGGTVVLMKDFDPLETLKLIEREKISNTFFVPTMVNFIMNLPEETKRAFNLQSLRVISSGAAPLLTKTKEEILKYFSSAKLYEIYSATELGIVTILRPEDQLRKIRCCGQPFTGVEIKLFDSEGKEVGMGEVGELFMKGFNTFQEYYKNPQGTNESRKGEWITAGDMARKDEEGYYYIVDRKKDMVISGGVNIYPIEIDEIIQKHPKVLEVAVVGIPDEVWGESLKAVVVLRDGEKASEEEIKEFCEGQLAKYKIPRTVEFTSALPRTPSGKIQKSVIKSRYWKGSDIRV